MVFDCDSATAPDARERRQPLPPLGAILRQPPSAAAYFAIFCVITLTNASAADLLAWSVIV